MNKKAVSNVLGLILMLLVVVSVVAILYSYTSGLVGTTVDTNPVLFIEFAQDDVDNTLTMIYAGQSNIPWSDFTIKASDGTTLLTMGLNLDIEGASFNPRTDFVTGGDIIYITENKTTISVVYNPTDTMISTWEFS